MGEVNHCWPLTLLMLAPGMEQERARQARAGGTELSRGHARAWAFCEATHTIKAIRPIHR